MTRDADTLRTSAACFLLFLVVWPVTVTSRTIPTVLPPGVDKLAPKDKSGLTGPRSAAVASSDYEGPCTLTAEYPAQARHALDSLVKNKQDRVIELDLELPDYPPSFLDLRLSNVFMPTRWVRTVGRQGRQMLVLKDNYDVLSLHLLRIRVGNMNVTITDSPKDCLKKLNESETFKALRVLMLNDFTSQDQEDGVLPSIDKHICNRIVRNHKGLADFVYQCCHKNPLDNEVVCHDEVDDVWVALLDLFILVLKFLFVLFSPFFIPARLYDRVEDNDEYVLYRKNDAVAGQGGGGGDVRAVSDGVIRSISGIEEGRDSPRQGDSVDNGGAGDTASENRVGSARQDSTDPSTVEPDSATRTSMRQVSTNPSLPSGALRATEFAYEIKVEFIKDVNESRKVFRQNSRGSQEAEPVTIPILAHESNRRTQCDNSGETRAQGSRCGHTEDMVNLCDANGLTRFKEKVLQKNPEGGGKVYSVKFDHTRLGVKAARVLDENTVPVHPVLLLYDVLVRCSIRKCRSLRTCCKARVIQQCSCTWKDCGKVLGTILTLLLLSIPSIVRLVLYWASELDLLEKKQEMASRFNLSLDVFGTMLVPIYPIFVCTFAIITVDLLVYGVLNRATKSRLRALLKDGLRDMYNQSTRKTISLGALFLFKPFEKGLVGTIMFLCRLLQMLVFVPFIVVARIPILDLTLRLMYDIVVFLFPDKEMFKKRGRRLKLFRHSDQSRCVTWCVRFLALVMCVLTLWSVAMLFMETVTFFVEMAVYIFMGIIVNAEVTVQYVFVLLYIVLYGRSTFSEVRVQYTSYHQKVHKELLKMVKEELAEKACRDRNVQDNMAFLVPGYASIAKLKSQISLATSLQSVVAEVIDGNSTTIDSRNTSDNSDIQLVVRNGMLKWRTGLLVFLSDEDVSYIPAKFFHRAAKLEYKGAPGPLDVSLLQAVWNFVYILLFLLFIFIVVMAFGDAYRISTTSQLLATVAGGLVPFLFRTVWVRGPSGPPLDTDNVQFQNELHNVITHFKQHWPVYDFGGPVPGSKKDRHDDFDEEVDDDDSIYEDYSDLIERKEVVSEQPSPTPNYKYPKRGSYLQNQTTVNCSSPAEVAVEQLSHACNDPSSSVETDVELQCCGSAIAPFCKDFTPQCHCNASICACCRHKKDDAPDGKDAASAFSQISSRVKRETVLLEPSCGQSKVVINLKGLNKKNTERISHDSYRIAYFRKTKR